MTLRILNGVNSSSSSSSSSSLPTTDINHVNSDFVVILAALLCALICILGLVAVARCAWIRRIAYTSAPLATTTTTTTTQPPANKGLKKKALNSLPKLTYSNPAHAGCSKFSVDCAICLAEFVSGDQIRLLPQCGHVFHVGCVDTWLKSHSSCPSCRLQILVVDTATATTTRCQKCGELPSATSSSSSSSSVAAAGTGTTTTTITTPSRQDEINRFLP